MSKILTVSRKSHHPIETLNTCVHMHRGSRVIPQRFVLIILPASAASALVQQLIDVQLTRQISNKMVKQLITLGREYVRKYEKSLTGGDRKKK